MALVVAMLRALVDEGLEPGELATRLNVQVSRHAPGSRFVTMVVGLYDPDSGGLVYVNAGQNPPLLRRASGAFERLTEGGMALGMFDQSVYTTGRLTLDPGDVLVLYSDGVTEAENMSGVAFDEGGLQIVIGQHWWQDLNTLGTSVAPLDIVGAREAFEARRLIEVHCAGLAAVHASEDEVAQIRATLDDGEAAVEDNDQAALAAMDEAFHVAVAAASGNRALAKMVVTLHHQTARYWLYAMRGPDPNDGMAALNEHRALADALASRNVERARAEMLKVLGDFPTEIKRSLESR